jgi:uncharacterized protein (TIGR03000 family)
MKPSSLHTPGLAALLALLLISEPVEARDKFRPIPHHHHHHPLHSQPIFFPSAGVLHPGFIPGVGVIPQIVPSVIMPVPVPAPQPPIEIRMTFQPDRRAVAVQPKQAPKQSHLQVFLPVENAEVWIDGKETTEKGVNRRYTLDDLASGQVNQVVVKAEWRVDGSTVTREEKVNVARGATTIVDFTRPKTRDR